MLIFGCCARDDRHTWSRRAEPSIETARRADDIVIVEDGNDGICAAYNRVLGIANATPGVEGVVFIHEDIQILDRNFRAKVINALAAPHVGIVGVVGGTGLTGLEWWSARHTVGSVFETRRLQQLGPPTGDVDAVDGLLLAMSPQACAMLRFDESAFPRFHGYDVDICLQARTAGLTVRVADISLMHHTAGGFGDAEAFDRAEHALQAKWPGEVRALRLHETVGRRAHSIRAKLAIPPSELIAKARRRVTRSDSPADTIKRVEDAVPSPSCPICGRQVPADGLPPGIIECSECHIGVSWPPPRRDVVGDGIWKERYGDSRLARRDDWLREARRRVEWLELLSPEGFLLEVGTGTGEFIHEASRAGYDAHGVEISQWAAKEAQDLGADVHEGDLSSWISANPGIRADIAALWHVIEHVPDPVQLLTEVRSVVFPGGLVVIEVPNFASSDARLLGIDWDGAQLLDHFHHYRPESMTKLLKAAGWEEIEVLEIATRLYEPLSTWRAKKNTALADGRPWPPLDLLRVRARNPE